LAKSGIKENQFVSVINESPSAQNWRICWLFPRARVRVGAKTAQLVQRNPRVIARLVFLGDDQPKPYRLLDVDQAIADIGAHVSAAGDLLRRGLALPGRDAREDWNDFRLALPVASETYFQIKQAAFGRAFGDFARIWSVR
jgi:hypothetical protein